MERWQRPEEDGTSRNALLHHRRKEVRDAQDRYTALSDQILLMQKELMLLMPDHRFVRSDTVTPIVEYVPMLQGKWVPPESGVHGTTIGSPDQPSVPKVESILTTLKQRATFRVPDASLLSRQMRRDARGAARSMPSLSSDSDFALLEERKKLFE